MFPQARAISRLRSHPAPGRGRADGLTPPHTTPHAVAVFSPDAETTGNRAGVPHLAGMSVPKPPASAGVEGRRLWRSVLAEFELSGHELAVLRQAVRAADRCEALAGVLEETGLTTTTAHGGLKLNPVASELRACELGLARLLCALRIPLGGEQDGDQRTGQHRGMRGVYGLGRAS